MIRTELQSWRRNDFEQTEAKISLFGNVLSELQYAERLMGTQYKRYRMVHVDSFEQLRAYQRDFQSHKYVLERDDITQSVYDSVKKSEPTLNIQTFFFGEIVRQYGYFFVGNTFPYNMPEKTEHALLWCKNNALVEQSAIYLADKFYEMGVTKNDFVVTRNPIRFRALQISCTITYLLTPHMETDSGGI